MDQAKLAEILCKIPEGVFNLLYLGRRVKRDGQILNAKAQLLCKVVDKQAVPIEQETVENARQQLEVLGTSLGGEFIDLPSVEDFGIPGPGGDIPVRLYKPRLSDADNPLPVMVAFHGGGFIRGSIESHDGMFRRLAKFGDFAVMSVEYRLAPEHVFPAAVDDAYAALRWAQEHGAEKGLDQKRVAIGGDSSGGNLAAVAAQDAKRNGTPQPAFQLLIYPTTDTHFTANSHKLFSKGFFLTEEKMQWYRSLYLGDDLSKMDDERASPSMCKDLSGLSPTMIITAGFDPLRDEAEEYAKALKDANVPVGVVRYQSMVHGFMSLSGLIKEADQALQSAAAETRAAFQRIP